MIKYMSLAILIVTAARVTYASSLFGSPPTQPDFYGMLLAALTGIEPPTDASGKNLKYDKSTSTWTDECPCIKDCEYGVDDGDFETCPQCLLGPGDTCDSWSGDCGDNMLCVYAGPIECSGKCVLEEDFNSKEIGETCSEFEGQCRDGLRCKYNEEFTFLIYGGMMPEPGKCVDEASFNSQDEGESCGELVGGCTDGLKCRGSMFPFTPQYCVSEDNDRTFSQFQQNPMLSLQDIFGQPDEIDIVLFDENSEDEAMADVLDMIEDMGIDPENDEIEVIFTEEDTGEENTAGHVDVEVIVHTGKHSSSKKVIDIGNKDEETEDVIVLDIESLKEFTTMDNDDVPFDFDAENERSVIVLDIETPKEVEIEDDKNFAFDVDDGVLVLDLMKPQQVEDSDFILKMSKDDDEQDDKFFQIL